MNEKDQQQVDVAGSPRRVLVCGSRSWAGWRSGGSWAPSPQQRHEAAVLISALERVFCEEDAPVPILVHGACRTGADALADYWAHRHGILIEVYPANWVGACRVSCRPGHRRVRPDGSDYCPSAGINRNADMIASLRPGRDVVIAAWDGISRGTANTIRLARKAGVEVVHVGVADRQTTEPDVRSRWPAGRRTPTTARGRGPLGGGGVLAR